MKKTVAPGKALRKYSAKRRSLRKHGAEREHAPGGSLPQHIAIIMDGNGRWAERHSMPRRFGHAAGAETFRTISEYCGERGIAVLTVFVLSTENWSRPPEELDNIIALLRQYLDEACERLATKNAQLRFLGDLSVFPPDILARIERIRAISARQTGIVVNLCLNYGGRADITQAAQSLAAQCEAGTLRAADIDAPMLERALYTGGQPPVDLLIRTGAERRISNFLLWQAAYAELYFTDMLWPDFDPAVLERAIRWYQSRSRRFGGVQRGSRPESP